MYLVGLLEISPQQEHTTLILGDRLDHIARVLQFLLESRERKKYNHVLLLIQDLQPAVPTSGACVR